MQLYTINNDEFNTQDDVQYQNHKKKHSQNSVLPYNDTRLCRVQFSNQVDIIIIKKITPSLLNSIKCAENDFLFPFRISDLLTYCVLLYIGFETGEVYVLSFGIDVWRCVEAPSISKTVKWCKCRTYVEILSPSAIYNQFLKKSRL